MNTKINDPIESEDILRKRKSSQFQLKQYKNSTIIYIYIYIYTNTSNNNIMKENFIINIRY